jgi:hypothetical protein
LFGHSYNFLFYGLKINSALLGGRAEKNAIDVFNNTLNIPHVKVLSGDNLPIYFNDWLWKILMQVIKDINILLWMQKRDAVYWKKNNLRFSLNPRLTQTQSANLHLYQNSY